MSEQTDTATDDNPVDWNRFSAVAAARQAIMWAGVPVHEAERYASLAVDAIIHADVMLPTGTRTVEQFAARVMVDGQPVEAIPEATTRERAEARVKHHDRERAKNPGWRGSAELVRRRQHTTAWERVPPPRSQPSIEDALEALGDHPIGIRFWVCPIPGHSDRKGEGGRPVVTVEWRGDTAYCTFPDCKRNSQQTTKDEEAP